MMRQSIVKEVGPGKHTAKFMIVTPNDPTQETVFRSNKELLGAH